MEAVSGRRRTKEEASNLTASSSRYLPTKSGQHIFLRFPTLAPFQSHPFTVITLPNPDPNRESQIVCIARVLKGNTRSLHNYIQKQSEDLEGRSSSSVALQDGSTAESVNLQARLLPAVIDGPYGSDGCIVAGYESVLMVVGGLGLTFALPLMMTLCRSSSCTRSLRLLWSIRTRSEWTREGPLRSTRS